MLTQVEPRWLDTDNVLLTQNNNELRIPRLEIFKQLGVGGTIRIRNEEYPETATIGTNLIHFGLPVLNECVDKPVVLSRILKNGYFNKANNQEKLPLLSFKEVWIAQVNGLIKSIPYESLTERYFQNTIGQCTNVLELQNLILSRYCKALPDLKDEEIISQGVSVRRLKLLRKASFS